MHFVFFVKTKNVNLKVWVFFFFLFFFVSKQIFILNLFISRFLLGSVVGVGIGMFVEQNYSEIPDVEKTIRDFIEDIKNAAKPKK